MPRTQLPPSKRLYLRNLPRYVDEEILLKHLSGYGKIVEVKIIHDYAFVQFDLEEDARDVVETFQSQPFLGHAIIVEFARPLRKNMPLFETSNRIDASVIPRPAPANVQSRYPIVVTNIPRKVRWQELKDFGRISGALVAYCDLDKKRRGRGFIEYFSREDAHRAIRDLDGRLLGGKPVTVSGLHESFSRGHRSRSRSPERCEEVSRQCLPSQYGHSAVAHLYKSGSREHHHYESLPPSYSYHDSSLSNHYSQHQSSMYYPIPPLSSPTERVSIPEPHIPYPTVTHRPTDIAYYDTEEQYDYAGHSIRLDSWKYDYDREYDHQKYGPQRELERPLQIDYRPGEMGYFHHRH
ncbi:hypothetical protein BDZ94DRAFT_570073 [Collybia nuda]|uniref:RRM domain-containing protein n=1 Tax=Collybia nuda TaxID=64659 RepID=A0A9P6CK19_9AGAR|nr:hypothetical protein BDZ94DRAFT_570073 [Collybia nuda]